MYLEFGDFTVFFNILGECSHRFDGHFVFIMYLGPLYLHMWTRVNVQVHCFCIDVNVYMYTLDTCICISVTNVCLSVL